ncbi:MAG TPA: hypothetical protein VFO83_03640 [Aggregicoccus sp.]|nr:hypothetical protein [Aggregicoccus sp.]
MAKQEQEQEQAPPETKRPEPEAAPAAPRAEEDMAEGALREALNRGDYGVDYQTSDYSQDAEQDEATHAENAVHPR